MSAMEANPVSDLSASPKPASRLIALRDHWGFITAVMALLCFALTLLAARETSPWKLDLRFDNDTVRYYDTQQFEVHGIGDFFRALADPFFRAPNAGPIEAPAGKPVLVDTLRLWGMGTRLFFGHDAWVTRGAYFNFQLFAYGLLALTIGAIGWRLGSPYLGMAAAIIAVLNPWAMVQLVYRNYTCLGMAMLFGACWLVLRRTYLSSFLAGILAWMAFLTDNAILLYSGMLGLVVLAGWWGQWRRMVRHGLLFFSGLVAPYAILSLAGLFWYPEYHWPVRVTMEYFSHFAKDNHFATRPPPEARPTVPKYPGIALLFIYENSRVIFGLIIAVLVIVFWKSAKLGVRNALAHKALGPIIGLMAPIVLVWIAIDIKPGAQVAHAYFVGYPLMVLALVIFWWRLANRRVIVRVVWALLALVYLTETAFGLQRYRQVFFSLQETVIPSMTPDKHEKLAILFNDPHAKIMQHLLNPEMSDRIVLILSLLDVGKLAEGKDIPTFKLTGPGLMQFQQTTLEPGDYISHVLFGPETAETVVYCPPVPVWKDDPLHGQRVILKDATEIADADGQAIARFSDPIRIPFYGLYPLIVFDDEWPTWKYLTGVIDNDSCMNDPGLIRLSKVTYPKGLPHGASK